MHLELKEPLAPFDGDVLAVDLDVDALLATVIGAFAIRDMSATPSGYEGDDFTAVALFAASRSVITPFEVEMIAMPGRHGPSAILRDSYRCRPGRLTRFT